MAISKKGSRKIVVEEQRFYWRFNEKIFVSKGEDRKGLLVIDFGWFDVWLFVNDLINKPPDYNPKVVTPEFVRRGIEYANSNGWNPEGDSNAFEIRYREGEFK